MKEVIIVIDQDGNCSIDGKGFIGTECEKCLGEIENSIGIRSKVQYKTEYRQREQSHNRNRETNGRS